MNKKILCVFGTRPEAIKMAPLVLELKRRSGLECVTCLTAQHREMLDSVMEIFSLNGDYDLNIMQQRQTLSMITTKALVGMETVLQDTKPDLVLVHGDTSTTFAGALAAFYQQIPVGHVEAGLRTGDMYSPFPEEMNRTLTGDIARLHFAPTKNNLANLQAEGIRGDIFVTGNTVIDAMRYTVRDDFTFTAPELLSLDWNKRVIVMTCHRRENYGKPMENIMCAVRDIMRLHPECELVYPVHLSPVVRECVFPILSDMPNVHLIDPVNVEEMHNLMARCSFVLTDSGGLQEEAPSLGKPVLVLRRETERPEAVEAGTVRIAGTDYDGVYAMTEALLTDDGMYQQMAHAVNPYGDGHACSRIADAIAWHFGLRAQRPDDFLPG